MLLELKKLLNSKVETKSGQHLGRVVDVYIDDNTQEVVQYEVEHNLIGGLMGKKLLIHRQQVVEFQENKIIVEDGMVKQGKLVPAMDVDV